MNHTSFSYARLSLLLLAATRLPFDAPCTSDAAFPASAHALRRAVIHFVRSKDKSDRII